MVEEAENSKINELTEERDYWKRQYEVILAQNNYHQNALAEQNKITIELQTKLQNTQTEAVQTFNKYNNLKNNVSSMEKEVSRLEQNSKLIKAEVEVRKVELNRSLEVCHEQEQKLKEKDTTITTLRSQLRELTQKFDQLKVDKFNLENQVKERKRKFKNILKFSSFKKVKH